MKTYYSLFLFIVFVSFPVAALSKPHKANSRRAPAASDHERLQKIFSLEDHRSNQVSYLVSSLRSSSPTVVKAALIALGRIGDPAGIGEMPRILNGRDRELKKAAAFALGQIGGETSLKFITQHLQMQTDTDVLVPLLRALGRAGNERSVFIFSDFIKDNGNKTVIQAACQGLGSLWSQEGSEKWDFPQPLFTKLAKLAWGQEPGATAAAFALSRFKGDSKALPVPDLLQAETAATSPMARALLTKTLGRIKSPAVAHFLSDTLAKDPSAMVRLEAARGLAIADVTPEILASLRKALGDVSPRVVVAALDSLAKYGTSASAIADTVAALYQTAASRWVRGTALKTLVQIQPIAGTQEVAAVLNVPSAPLFPYAISALGASASAKDLEKITEYVNDESLRNANLAVGALDTLTEGDFSVPLKTALRNALQRSDIGLTTQIAQLVEKFQWKEFSHALASIYPLIQDSQEIEAKVAVLNALAAVGDHSNLDLLNSAINDPDRQVAEAAVAAVKAQGGKDESARIPRNNVVKGNPPDLSAAQSSARVKVRLTTDRGNIEISMREEAPLTALNFLKLVRKKFYDGKTFHRIVSNFVAQGGDPRGDGFGGPGYMIRDEVSTFNHERGVVGMATAGKDTGGSQFFIDLGPNYHLDGKYTAFGEVTDGIEVAEKLEPGDKIIIAREVFSSKSASKEISKKNR